MRGALVIFASALSAAAVFFGAMPAHSAGITSGSLRAGLMAEKSVETLYSIDAFNTYVVTRGLDLGEIAPAGVTVLRRAGNGPVVTSVIRHDSPEPILFKSAALAGHGGLAALPAGEIRLKATDAGTAGDDALYTEADLYQHAYSACVSSGGAPSFVIPIRQGSFKRLTSVGALKAFDYITGPGRSGSKTWYVACEGDEKFVVEKTYRFLSNGADVAVVARGRGLEGVSYVAEAPLASDFSRAGSAVEPSKGFLREMASEVGNLKGRLVKVKGGSKFSGSYISPSPEEDCARVSIKRTWTQPEVEKTLEKVYDFKLCENNL